MTTDLEQSGAERQARARHALRLHVAARTVTIRRRRWGVAHTVRHVTLCQICGLEWPCPISIRAKQEAKHR